RSLRYLRLSFFVGDPINKYVRISLLLNGLSKCLCYPSSSYVHLLLLIFLNGLLESFFFRLKSRRCSSVVEARLLSFWEVRNFKRCGGAHDSRQRECFMLHFSVCSSFDLKDNVFVILTGWWFGIDMRSTAKMDETGIKVSGWNYKSVGEIEHQYLKMQIVISTNDYRGSINFTTNLSQLDLDLRLQLPKLPLPSINTYNSYSFFPCQGVEVRLSAVNTRMICCRRPGLLLATRKALDKLGFGCHQAVISCFDGWDSYKNFVVPYFVVCEYQQYQGHEILLDSIKAVLSYTVGYAVIFSKEMQKMVRSYDLSN
ncbi:hypothetical protein HID58_013209, partial [Brassica napus]